MTRPFSRVGKPRRRVDGRSKATGQTRFADDLFMPRMLHCRLLRSHLPHAEIKHIDTSRALAHPDVHLVLECESIDGRTRIGKALAATACTIDCRRPFDHPPPWQQGAEPWDHPLAAWVVAEGALHGVVMRKPVAHLLTQRVGNEPGLLSRECARLAAILGGDRKSPQPLEEPRLDALVPDDVNSMMQR